MSAEHGQNTLREQTLAGLGWSVRAQVLNQTVHFGLWVFLARLLAPADFGLLGMVTVFTAFLRIFGEFGFGAALIQKVGIQEEHFHSVFWLNVAIGVFLAALTFAVAPAVGIFYAEPRLAPLVRCLSLVFVLDGFAIIHRTVLSRRMEFRAIGMAEIWATILAGIAATGMAVGGLGVWSLVVQQLATAGVGMVALWGFSRWLPSATFTWSAIRDLFGFSANLQGFNLVNYWLRNLDKLLIGKFLSSSALGIYSRGYMTMLLPLNQISRTLGRVMFPALSRIQHDRDRVCRIYLQALKMISLVSFPLMAGLLVVSDSFVLALYGPKWEAVIPVLRVLCVAGLVQSVISPGGWIYLSQGRTDIHFRWGVVAGVVILGGVVAGILLGTVRSVACCYTIAFCSLIYPMVMIPGRLIGMKFSAFLKAVGGPFVSAAAMAVVVAAATHLAPDGLPAIALLCSQALVGVLVYGLLVRFLDQTACREATDLAISLWRKTRSRRLGRDCQSG